MLDYSKVRFLWRGDAGRKVSSGRYEKIYDMGPRAATGDAAFATAATRPIVDELSDWYGLAVDPAATNLLLRSQEFNTASWTLSRTSAFGSGSVGNDTLAPDGTVTAEYIQQATGETISGGVLQAKSYTTGTTYTLSVFAKEKENQFARIGFSIGTIGAGIFCGFDLKNGVVGTPDAGVTARIEQYPDGWYRCSVTAVSQVTGTYNTFVYQSSNLNTLTTTPLNGIYIWGAQLETGAVATQYKKTEGTTTAYSAVVAPITDAIPITGTIIVWDNLVNAYPGADRNRVIGSEDLSATYLVLSKDYTNPEQLVFYGHNNVPLNSANLLWQPSNQRKRWFFAMTYNGSTVQVYRGDVQGNFAKVLDVAYTPTTAAIRDMYLNSNAGGTGQVGNSYLDIMTYDEVMTAEQIEDIYYGTIPVFQQTAYAGTFVDKFRQKVQAEPASTYDTTLEAEVLADWSTEL